MGLTGLSARCYAMIRILIRIRYWKRSNSLGLWQNMMNEMCECDPTFCYLFLSYHQRGEGGVTVSIGSILIIAVYVYLMRCNLEERRTSYSWQSLEWIGVEEGVDIQWEEFHSFPIEHNKSFITSHFYDRGWQRQSNHCTTVADLNRARHHMTDSNCISLQDHRQQWILIARNHPILVCQDSFCPPPTLAISARHFEGRCYFVVQNRRIPPQNDNLREELLSGTEKSFFPCQLTWLKTQFSAFTQTQSWFDFSSVHSAASQCHDALWSASGLPQLPSFPHSASQDLSYISPTDGALSFWHSLAQ